MSLRGGHGPTWQSPDIRRCLTFSGGGILSHEINTEVQAVLDGFLKQQGITDSNVQLNPLAGGRSGAGIFTFELDNQTYVLRMFAAMEALSGRKRESKITAEVSKLGFAPVVYYVDSAFSGMVLEYLPVHTLLPAESKQPKNLELFARFLHELHHVEIERLSADGYFKRAKDWLFKAEKNRDNFPTGMDKLLEAVDEIEHVMSAHLIPERLIHSDLISRNIMFDGEQFKLVDWPASGYGNPYWDFIDFIDYQALNEQEARLFFAAYYGREITQTEWDIFVVLRPVPSIVRLIGGFAFMPDIRSKAFYDEKRQANRLPTFNQAINDFAFGQLNIEPWELTLLFLLEAERQLKSEEFKSSYARLASD